MKRPYAIIIHILVWLIVYLLPHGVAYGRLNTNVLFNEPGGIIHAVSTALLIAYAYFNYYFLVPRLYLQRHYFAYFFCVLAGVALVIWFPQIFHFVEHGRHFDFPPPDMDHHHHDGHGPGGLFRMSYNIVLFVICTFVSISIQQQKELILIQKEKMNAEISFLKAQINPHFLFNTLNSIYALAIRKSDDTPRAITQLSELMRYILKDSDSDTVPLDKELNYISNYIALQKRRLGNTVRIIESLPEVVSSIPIAPLILMSFVENAFKHGVNPAQDSFIEISVFLQDSRLILYALNNIVSPANREETMGIGLKNATSRLEHLYPGRHILTIDRADKTFAVHLIIDLYD